MTQGIGISPEFLELIRQAARETKRIQLPSKALAVQLRQRVHSARKHLFKSASKPNATAEDRTYADLAQSIETSIELDSIAGQYTLVVRPRDFQFREALAAAGVRVEATAAPTPEAPLTPAFVRPTPDILAEYLDKKKDDAGK